MRNHTMNTFENHFHLKTLLKLIEEQNNGIELSKQRLTSFFNCDVDKFLEEFHREKELLYFSKNKYHDFLKSRQIMFQNLLRSLDENILSTKYFQSLFLPPPDLLSIRRFQKFGTTWGYIKDKLDCISLSSNRAILLHGVGVLKALKSPDRLTLLMKIVEGESSEGKVLFERGYEIKEAKENDIIERVLFEPIIIKEDKVYSICLKIEGGDSFNGYEGEEFVEREGLVVRFFDTLVVGNNRNNNTNVIHGQIPEIYFSLL